MKVEKSMSIIATLGKVYCFHNLKWLESCYICTFVYTLVYTLACAIAKLDGLNFEKLFFLLLLSNAFLTTMQMSIEVFNLLCPISQFPVDFRGLSDF